MNNLKKKVQAANLTILSNITNSDKNDAYINNLKNAYENYINFDKTVATGSGIMYKKFIELKDYFFSIQFSLMFFTICYFIFFIAIIFFYVCYICREKNYLWYIIIILIHLLLLVILVVTFLSTFFGQIRLICHEIPRAMNFIFLGNYITSGNTASYPPKFGEKNENMTKMFTTCLNGNGSLTSLFLEQADLILWEIYKNTSTSLYNDVKNNVDNSNLITKNYDNIKNSALFKAIFNLTTMKDNLYMATEGFGNDDISIILRNIRTYLDYPNCSMTNESFVVRASECPAGSKQLTDIDYTPGVPHCYIIQNLSPTAHASYSNQGCETANTYINLTIPFIKEIYKIVDDRLSLLKNYQICYSYTFSSLLQEATTISNKINSTYNELQESLNSSSISNCSSVRYDLIDFSDFISDTIQYDAHIVMIFSAFIGVFGYVMLYSFLVLINSFSYNENGQDDDDEYDYSKSKSKYGYINNINRSKPKKRETIDNEEEEEEEEDNNKIKLNNKKKVNIPVKTGQKVEMSYLSKNNEDSDSS